MTDTAIATREQPQLTPFEVIERVITNGDLAKMTAPDRVAFYWRTCESLGLNPLTRPFEFITLNGKLTMYARKDATEQLRKINAVSVVELRRDRDDDLGLLTVYARGRDKTGREDEASGAVSIKGLSGEALANAVMKAETKAKRRLTLSLVGLGFLDESEVDGAAPEVDPTTGAVIDRPKPQSLLESVKAQQAALESTPAAEPAQATADPEVEAADGVWTDLDDEDGTDAPALTELTLDAFKALRAQHEVGPALVKAVAQERYPEAASLAALSDQERAALWLAIEQRLTAQEV